MIGSHSGPATMGKWNVQQGTQVKSGRSVRLTQPSRFLQKSLRSGPCATSSSIRTSRQAGWDMIANVGRSTAPWIPSDPAA
ncbi:hypothetical protein VTN49DRAFT_5045 [Thermomyces lanuginosus]|uniref:uncharacterized protein n=1 Tax=Thermomyces lanuginosus TaxID=5541 RepID=UPI00374260A7